MSTKKGLEARIGMALTILVPLALSEKAEPGSRDQRIAELLYQACITLQGNDREPRHPLMRGMRSILGESR